MDNFQKRLWLMRMRLTAWATIMNDWRSEHESRMVMVMLTYKKVEDYKPGHINDYMKNLKQRLDKKLIGFAWVAEIQKRGAVHYHLILVTEKGTRIPLPDKSGMWKLGWSGIHTARTPWYLLTYAGKEHQKDLARYPKSARMYAASLRGLSDGAKAQFRLLSGTSVSDKDGALSDEIGDDKFLYVGSAVTLDYAKGVLLPPGAVLDE
jgi:hypothetical protein